MIRLNPQIEKKVNFALNLEGVSHDKIDTSMK